MKKWCTVFILMLFFTAAAQWRLDKPDANSLVLYNDTTNAVPKVLPLIGGNVHIRKSFDLTQLPPEWRSGIGGAALRIYMQAADQSEAVRKIPRNGLTEELEILVNGHSMILKTADPRLPSSRKWADLSIPADWISGDRLDVVMHKIDSKTNDDFVYVGVDTAATPESSQVSVDHGKNFRFENNALLGLKGEYSIRLVLLRQNNELRIDFAKDGLAAVKLENNAQLTGGLLQFDGLESAAKLEAGSNFNVTEAGLTIAAVVRMKGALPPGKTSHDMMIACKPDAWFIGRTGNRFNFSFCSDGQNWNNALLGGEFPEFDEWMHVAAVFERVNESAQGNVGYRLSVYLNGELVTRKMFLYAVPTASAHPVIIGNGNFKNYGLNGNIASFELFKRGLNDGEVAVLAKNAKLISRKAAGFYEIDSKLAELLDRQKKQTATPEARWLVEALRRAAEAGYDQNKLSGLLAKNTVFSSKETGEKFAAAWNQLQNEFELLSGDGALLLVVSGKEGGNSPVAGWYNPVTGEDVFAGRSSGWMLDIDGERVYDRSPGVSFEVTEVKKQVKGASFTVTWNKPGEFTCRSQFVFSGNRLEQTLEVSGIKTERRLRETVFPLYFLNKLPGKDDSLVFPLFSGVLRRNPTRNFSESGLYPTARAAMQFIGYFDQSGNGIYSGFEAVDGGTKTLSTVGSNGILNVKWNNPVAANQNAFKSAGPGVLEIYQGNWFEAGQIYKRFVEAKAPWRVTTLPRTDTPKWYHDNTLWFIMSPGTVNSALYLREYFELPYAIWLCRWADVTKSDHPVIRPTDAAVEAIRTFNAAGIFAHPYLNARLWGYIEDQKQFFDTASSPGAQANGIVQENGKPYLENYDNYYAVMCPDSPGWRNMLLDNVKALSDSQAHGTYWDQLPCGSAQLCFSDTHGHAPGDPTAWVRGYRRLLTEERKQYPHLAIDGEDNVEVYVDKVDGFMSWRFTEPDHVPLFQSVYGGGRVQFTGRGFDAFGSGPGSYEATFAKLGEQFVCGEQIGWFHINDIRFGCPRRMYAKKLAHLRQALLGYLNAADMLAPIKYKKAMPQMTVIWGNTRGRQVTTDKIRSCAWRRLSDGRIAVLFTNTTDETISVEPDISFPVMDKLAVCAEGAAKPEFIDLSTASLPGVVLGPYVSCIWLFGKNFDRNEAGNISAVTAKVAAFTDGGQSIQRYAPRFDSRKQLKAEPGQWLRAIDSSWMVFAFMESETTLGYKPGGTPEERGNWIMARDGALVSYGEVEFPANGAGMLEFDVAADKEHAGTRISIWDVTGDHHPDRLLAELTVPETGGWFDFKTFRVPLSQVSGKRNIVLKFTGKGCNFRGWRIVK